MWFEPESNSFNRMECEKYAEDPRVSQEPTDIVIYRQYHDP